MLNAASPIQAPDPSMIAELSVLIDSGSVTSGPVMGFCSRRNVFLVVVVEQGIVVHWQLESCNGEEEAAGLKARYFAQVQETARLVDSLVASAAASAGPTHAAVDKIS